MHTPRYVLIGVLPDRFVERSTRPRLLPVGVGRGGACADYRIDRITEAMVFGSNGTTWTA
jgi:hypothetical protein